MFIKKIKVNNFRTFNEFSMEFKEGLNVIIGSNNSGKTNLLRAIKLLDDPNRISIEDFNKNNMLKYYLSSYKKIPPEITLEYEIHHFIDENNTDDESIIKLLSFLGLDKIQEQKRQRQSLSGEMREEITKYNLIAYVKMKYHLDNKYLGTYIQSVQNIDNFEKFKSILGVLLKHYKWTFTNGLTSLEVRKEEVSNIFEIDFIEAERTNDAIYKETTKEINKYIKDEQNVDSLQKMKEEIAELVKSQVKNVLEKIGTVIENEDNEIGLAKGNVAISQDIRPKTSISESYVIDIKDTKQEYTVPLTHNGVGYNNLVNIYMLIKLADIKKGNVSKILCLEEPEAHLHPAMQYKLFSYIRKIDEEDNLKQQIFVTTHSSNITAIAGIDNMYMLDYNRENENFDCVHQKLENQFLVDEEAIGEIENKAEKIKEESDLLDNSKKHIMKFLDVTRSDMLFASKIIFVEGIAEKLLIPELMKKVGCSYEDEHIAIVEIGGKHFKYFLDIYARNPVSKKVLCITDKDYNILDVDESGNKINSLCHIDYYINYLPDHVKNLRERYKDCDNIKILCQSGSGQTFEDELFLSNTISSTISKRMLKIVLSGTFNKLIEENELKFDIWSDKIDEIDGRATKIIKKYLKIFSEAIENHPQMKDEYEKLFFAKVFLYYAKSHKGDVALEILTSEILIKNLIVPKYIEEGLKWLLK